jgi:CheY-like chemotaxis protein
LESNVLYQSEVEAMTMVPELPRILLVDDDAQGLWLRAQVMKLCGFPVVTADGSIEALSLMAEATEKIDLAILDYDMPAMNGCDLADHLRSMYPRLKIILYSGAIDIPDNEMSSVDAFVSKDDGTARLLTQIVQLAQIRTRIPQSVVTDTELCFRANSGQY